MAIRRPPLPPKLHTVVPRDDGPSKQTRVFLWGFSVAMVVIAGTGLVMKLIEFYATATTEGADALASFLIPVLNYLLVAGGFFCLFFWAYFSGQFRDLEAAKYRMLEMHRDFERPRDR